MAVGFRITPGYPFVSQQIHWGLNTSPAPLEPMRMDHRGSDIAVIQKLQHRPDAGSGFEEEMCKGVAGTPTA